MGVNHYENFPVASLLLPPRFRHPVGQIYRFAREADDIADEGNASDTARLAQLESLREGLRAIERGTAPQISGFIELAAVIRDYHLPVDLFADLLSAFTQDVTTKSYADFPQLLDYCRRSANPVGRLLLKIFDGASEQNLQWSDAICTALQLINFWQDVGLDYAKGRIYLPRDEMDRCGATESNIAEKRCDDAWRTLIGFQIERTRKLMLFGAPLGHGLPGRIGLEIRATVHGGLRILEKLERARYDMFRNRPTLEWHDWPVILARAL